MNKTWLEYVQESDKSPSHAVTFLDKNDHTRVIFMGSFTECWYKIISNIESPMNLDGKVIDSIASAKASSEKSPKKIATFLGKNHKTHKNMILSIDPLPLLPRKVWDVDKEEMDKNLENALKKDFGSFGNLEK